MADFSNTTRVANEIPVICDLSDKILAGNAAVSGNTLHGVTKLYGPLFTQMKGEYRLETEHFLHANISRSGTWSASFPGGFTFAPITLGEIYEVLQDLESSGACAIF